MKTEGEPHDRLTRLSNVAIDAIQADPEHRDDKAIILLASGPTATSRRPIFWTHTGERGGIGLMGYENTLDAFADLIIHAKALAELHGKTLLLMPR
jgi:hypothetical protein